MHFEPQVDAILPLKRLLPSRRGGWVEGDRSEAKHGSNLPKQGPLQAISPCSITLCATERVTSASSPSWVERIRLSTGGNQDDWGTPDGPTGVELTVESNPGALSGLWCRPHTITSARGKRSGAHDLLEITVRNAARVATTLSQHYNARRVCTREVLRRRDVLPFPENFVRSPELCCKQQFCGRPHSQEGRRGNSAVLGALLCVAARRSNASSSSIRSCCTSARGCGRPRPVGEPIGPGLHACSPAAPRTPQGQARRTTKRCDLVASRGSDVVCCFIFVSHRKIVQFSHSSPHVSLSVPPHPARSPRSNHGFRPRRSRVYWQPRPPQQVPHRPLLHRWVRSLPRSRSRSLSPGAIFAALPRLLLHPKHR